MERANCKCGSASGSAAASAGLVWWCFLVPDPAASHYPSTGAAPGGQLGSMWGFCVPLASPLAWAPCTAVFAGVLIACMLVHHRMRHGVCIELAWRSHSPVLARVGVERSRGHSRLFVQKRVYETLAWPLPPVASTRQASTSTAEALLGNMLPVSRGGTEVHGANRGHNARECSL